MASTNAATELEVANLALQRIGKAPITDIDGTDKVSTAARRVLADTRDEVSRIMPWTCLIRRTALSTLSASGDSAFTYQLTLADNVLRVIDIIDADGAENVDYRLENQVIYYNLTAGYVRHISREATTIVHWDPLLLSCVECRTASKLAVYLTGDTQLSMALQQEYAQLLGAALQVRAVEVSDDNEKVLFQLQNALAQQILIAKSKKVVE
jgi:hypothetical protein